MSTSLVFGSDPELFFVKKGKVVPSSTVIPKDGLPVRDSGRIIRDGFQVELNPGSSFCRQIAASEIARAMRVLRDLEIRHKVEVSTEVGVVVDEETFKSIPLSERKFGCNPTENVYQEKLDRPTGARVRFRSGGGHIHIGLPQRFRGNEERIGELVKMFDILVGNSCVFFDQSPASTLRRKYYGRAGEYRMKPYGVEYRVPSNFWLQSYVLWSMVSGLCRQVVDLHYANFFNRLTKKVPLENVRKAINNNDKDLALENLRLLAEFIKEHDINLSSGLSVSNVDKFIRLVQSNIINQYPWKATRSEMFQDWETKLMYGADGFERTLDNVEI